MSSNGGRSFTSKSALAPLSGNIVRSPLASTKITTTPVGRPERIKFICSTPYLSKSEINAKPTGSLPTRATSWALVFVRVIHVATFAA